MIGREFDRTKGGHATAFATGQKPCVTTRRHDRLDLGAVPLKKTTSIVTDSETVKKFVFTGGPCGGKTTSLERVRAFLAQYGIGCTSSLRPRQ